MIKKHIVVVYTENEMVFILFNFRQVIPSTLLCEKNMLNIITLVSKILHQFYDNLYVKLE